MAELPENDPWDPWQDQGFNLLENLSDIEGIDWERNDANSFNVEKCLYGNTYTSLADRIDTYCERDDVPELSKVRARELIPHTLRATARVRLALLTRFLLAFYETEGGDPWANEIFPIGGEGEEEEDDQEQEQHDQQDQTDGSSEKSSAEQAAMPTPTVSLRRYVEQQLLMKMDELFRAWNAILDVLSEFKQKGGSTAQFIILKFEHLALIRQDLTEHLQLTQYEPKEEDGIIPRAKVGDSGIESMTQNWRQICPLPAKMAHRWVLRVAPGAVIREQPARLTIHDVADLPFVGWDRRRFVVIHVDKKREAAICYIGKKRWVLLSRPRLYYAYSD